MAFHVPFNQRGGGQGRVAIGFESPTPYRTRPKFNWWGFNGLWLAIMSLFSAGALSVIPLAISVIGMRSRPRKMAIAGTLISFLGVAMFASLIIGGLITESNRHNRMITARQNRVVAKQVVETKTLIVAAVDELAEYRDEHSGYLPNDIDSNMLVIKHIDPWETPLRFDSVKDGGIIRSAGPDQSFDTKDDVTKRIEGKGMDYDDILLPMD